MASRKRRSRDRGPRGERRDLTAISPRHQLQAGFAAGCDDRRHLVAVRRNRRGANVAAGTQRSTRRRRPRVGDLEQRAVAHDVEPDIGGGRCERVERLDVGGLPPGAALRDQRRAVCVDHIRSADVRGVERPDDLRGKRCPVTHPEGSETGQFDADAAAGDLRSLSAQRRSGREAVVDAGFEVFCRARDQPGEQDRRVCVLVAVQPPRVRNQVLMGAIGEVQRHRTVCRDEPTPVDHRAVGQRAVDQPLLPHADKADRGLDPPAGGQQLSVGLEYSDVVADETHAHRVLAALIDERVDLVEDDGVATLVPLLRRRCRQKSPGGRMPIRRRRRGFKKCTHQRFGVHVGLRNRNRVRRSLALEGFDWLRRRTLGYAAACGEHDRRHEQPDQRDESS